MSVKVRRWKDGWYVVVHMKGRRKVKKFQNEAAARAFADHLTAYLKIHGEEGLRLLDREPKSDAWTFKKYADKWLKEIQASNLKPSTVDRYVSSLKVHLIPFFGRLHLEDIDYALLKNFCLEKAKQRSRHSVRLMIAALRVVLKEAVREGLIPANPVTSLGKFFGTRSAGREQPDPFTRSEIADILEKIGERWPEYSEWVLCAVRTGLRFGEQRALKWEDIDFRRRVIHVRRNWPANSSLTTPKTRSSIRQVDMSPELSQALRRLRSRRKAQYLSLGKPEIPEWVFLSEKGRPIDHRNLMKGVWRRVLAAAQLRYRHWHTLRHTFASQLLMAGVSPLYVAKQLGHAQLSTTMNIYAHWIEEAGSGSRGVDVLDHVAEKSQNVSKTSVNITEGEK